MEWITNAANKRNAERHRKENIEKRAPVFWQNVCHAIEQAVRYYQRLDSRPRHLEFSGCANHTVYVAVFHKEKSHRAGAPMSEIGRVTIKFDDQQSVIEVQSAGAKARKFPMGLNAAGHVCLLDDKREITVEEFTELALRDALFPSDEEQSAESQWKTSNYRQEAGKDPDDD